MKPIFSLLAIGVMLSFTACQSKPKTEDAAIDSTTSMSVDSAAIVTDTTAIVVPADTTR